MTDNVFAGLLDEGSGPKPTFSQACATSIDQMRVLLELARLAVAYEDTLVDGWWKPTRAPDSGASQAEWDKYAADLRSEVERDAKIKRALREYSVFRHANLEVLRAAVGGAA